MHFRKSVFFATGFRVCSHTATQVFHFLPSILVQSHAAFFRHFLAPEMEGQTEAGAATGVATDVTGLVHVLYFASLLTRVKAHPAFTHFLDFLPNLAQFCPLRKRGGGCAEITKSGEE